MDNTMKISKIRLADVTRLDLSGSINKVDIPELRKAISQSSPSAVLLLDLSGVDFINSGFIGLLLELRKSMPNGFKEIRIQNPAGMVRDVLYLTGLDGFFNIGNADIMERRSP
jgi:anti-anti-sigma factor